MWRQRALWWELQDRHLFQNAQSVSQSALDAVSGVSLDVERWALPVMRQRGHGSFEPLLFLEVGGFRRAKESPSPPQMQVTH